MSFQIVDATGKPLSIAHNRFETKRQADKAMSYLRVAAGYGRLGVRQVSASAAPRKANARRLRGIARRPVGRGAKRNGRANGPHNEGMPDFTDLDIAHIMKTADKIRYTDDVPETVMTSIGYVDVWPEDDDGASVTVHRVNYRLDEPSPGRGHRKDNGRARLKRTIRACSARGKALKRSGSKVAASRLAKLCPPPGRRRKANGAPRAYVTLDGNMAPATVTKLKKLLDKRLPAVFQHADHPNSDTAAAMHRAKIAPASTDARGRYVYRISKARMMTLLPALLRSRNDADSDLARSLCEHFDINIA